MELPGKAVEPKFALGDSQTRLIPTPAGPCGVEQLHKIDAVGEGQVNLGGFRLQ